MRKYLYFLVSAFLITACSEHEHSNGIDEKVLAQRFYDIQSELVIPYLEDLKENYDLTSALDFTSMVLNEMTPDELKRYQGELNFISNQLQKDHISAEKFSSELNKNEFGILDNAADKTTQKFNTLPCTKDYDIAVRVASSALSVCLVATCIETVCWVVRVVV